jgi:hypothetical protein
MIRQLRSLGYRIEAPNPQPSQAQARFIQMKTIHLATAKKKMRAAAEAGATRNSWNMDMSVANDGGGNSSSPSEWMAQIASMQISQGEPTPL